MSITPPPLSHSPNQTRTGTSFSYPSWLPARPPNPTYTSYNSSRGKRDPEDDGAYASYRLSREGEGEREREPTVQELIRDEERRAALAKLETKGKSRQRQSESSERPAAPRPVRVTGSSTSRTAAGPSSIPLPTALPMPSPILHPYTRATPPAGLAPLSPTLPIPAPTSPSRNLPPPPTGQAQFSPLPPRPLPTRRSSSPEPPTARPRPRFKHPRFRPQLLHDPTTLAKLHFYLLPFFTFWHLPVQIFLDINAMYILVLAARFPDSPSPGEPGSGRVWALASFAYALFALLQYIFVFLIYELLYSTFRRWRPARPLVLPIYLSRPASALLSLSSFTRFSFLRQVRRSAWLSRSERGRGGWKDGFAELCYAYGQNWPTVGTLLPRGALCLAALLAFWSVQPGGELFGVGNGNAAMTTGRDGLFFVVGEGNLTNYGRGVLAVNAAWGVWRALILLASWIGLWALSGQAFAGICGPRTRWEESARIWTEKDQPASEGYAGSHEGDALVWGWRERAVVRVQEAWEYCLVDREGRRVGSSERTREKESPPQHVTPSPPRLREGVLETRERERESRQLPRGILTADLFAPTSLTSPRLSAGATTTGRSGDPTITMPTPHISGAPLPTQQPPLPFLGSSIPPTPAALPSSTSGPLFHAPPPPPVSPDPKLAARVQRILDMWVDPEEEDLGRGRYGDVPLSDSAGEEDVIYEADLVREREREIAEEEAAMAARRRREMELADARDFPSELEGEPVDPDMTERSARSASMSSLGAPVPVALRGPYPFEYRRVSARGSLSEDRSRSATGTAGSNNAAVGHSVGYSSNARTDSQSSSGRPQSSVEDRRPVFPLPPPPVARGGGGRHRQRAASSTSGSSPPSVAGVFRTRTASEPPTSIQPRSDSPPDTPDDEIGEYDIVSEEGDVEEDEDSVGLLSAPSRQSSLARLRRRASSRSSSSLAGAAGRRPHPSRGSTYYSDARSHAPGMTSASEGELPEVPHRESEELPMPVDRTFGQQADWPPSDVDSEGPVAGPSRPRGGNGRAYDRASQSPATTIHALRAMPSMTASTSDRTVSAPRRMGTSPAPSSLVTAPPDPGDGSQQGTVRSVSTWGGRVRGGLPGSGPGRPDPM